MKSTTMKLARVQVNKLVAVEAVKHNPPQRVPADDLHSSVDC